MRFIEYDNCIHCLCTVMYVRYYFMGTNELMLFVHLLLICVYLCIIKVIVMG